jgi:hypothetical protein
MFKSKLRSNGYPIELGTHTSSACRQNVIAKHTGLAIPAAENYPGSREVLL